MEYFASQDFDAKVSPQDSMTAAEADFIRKYMGMDPSQALASVPVIGDDARTQPVLAMPGGAPRVRAAAPAEASAEEAPIELSLRAAESVQLVGFYVGSQLYALPTLDIQEVIRRQEISQLPMAPCFVSGVINLRGRITPLIRLRALLDMPAAGQNDERFTIICRCRGLQFGVQIDQLQTMYRVMQPDLNWNAEASVGANVEFITGLFEVDDKLIPIISIDRLVDKVLNA
jgi:purine-binding chemotaxis protein CheW